MAVQPLDAGQDVATTRAPQSERQEAPVAPVFDGASLAARVLAPAAESAEEELRSFANIADDDRDDIGSTDRVLLIVENELGFARLLLEASRNAGFKGLVSGSGAGALTTIREYHPSAISLDIHLPDMEGWRILDRLKADPSTRHIPICVVSTDDAQERALGSGALGFLPKPLRSTDQIDAALAQLHRYLDRGSPTLLMVMPRSSERDAIVAALEPDVRVEVADDADFSPELLTQVDCLLIDESVEGLGPQDVLEAMEARGLCQLPVVLYNAGSPRSDGAWQQRASGFALRKAQGVQSALAQVAFLMHRNAAAMSEDERRACEAELGRASSLEGKKALIVDDDMRNIFALATVLDNEGMVIVSADNGHDPLAIRPDIESC